MPQLRCDARDIFNAGLAAADPEKAIRNHLRTDQGRLILKQRRYPLGPDRKVYVVGAGKASALMTRALEALLGNKVTGGAVLVKYGHSLPARRVEIIEAGHPVPDAQGLRGGERIIEILQRAGKEDLVLFVISGGGSALLPAPVEGITLAEKQAATQLLLGCGATIHEINAVRKHLSRIKGGRAAQLAYPATVVALVLSDVIGDTLDTIASGPTAPDNSTFADCLKILWRYEISDKIPAAVKAFLTRGAGGAIDETPKAADPIFRNVQNVIVGSNRLALRAAQRKSRSLGYKTLVLSSLVAGESRSVAAMHAAIAREIVSTGSPLAAPACVLSGGETTVTVRGAGMGGRNQEFALSAAIAIDGIDGIVILSGATDGTDGPTDAAGAIVDGSTLSRARAKGRDADHYLRNNDSYHFFQSSGDLLVTGPTLTNVMDLHIMLIA